MGAGVDAGLIDGFGVMGGPLVLLAKITLLAVIAYLAPLGLGLWVRDLRAHVRDMRVAARRRRRLECEIMGEYRMAVVDGWPSDDRRTFVEVARRVGARPAEVSYVLARENR